MNIDHPHRQISSSPPTPQGLCRFLTQQSLKQWNVNKCSIFLWYISSLALKYKKSWGKSLFETWSVLTSIAKIAFDHPPTPLCQTGTRGHTFFGPYFFWWKQEHKVYIFSNECINEYTIKGFFKGYPCLFDFLGPYINPWLLSSITYKILVKLTTFTLVLFPPFLESIAF